MEIRGTSSVHAAQTVRMNGGVTSTDKTPEVATLNVVDRLDISAEAHAANQLGDTADVRSSRIAEIKSQIANGTYDTDQKLNTAVERMLDQLV